MSESIPALPVGDSAMIRWARAIHDKVYGSGRLISTPNMRLQQMPRGTAIMPQAQKGGVSSSANFQAQFVSESDDYINCNLISAVTVAAGVPTGAVGASIKVAKPWHLRRQSYDGVTLPAPDSARAVYVNPHFREVVFTGDGVAAINQIIYPPYVPGDLIYCCIPTGGTGVATVTYQEIESGRMWAWAMPVCVNVDGTATDMCQYVPGSIPTITPLLS